MTAFINSQPLRVTDGITLLGENGWHCVPCFPDVPDDCSEWPTYGMLNLDPVTLAKSGLDPDAHILPIEEALDIIRAAPHINRHLYARPVQMATNPVVYGTVSFLFGSCEYYEGVYGVEGRPSHTPSHHDEIFCSGIGCICSSGPAWFVGARHDLFNTRNLGFHPDEPKEDRKYLHCFGITYSGRTTNLLDLIESFGLDLSNRVKWVVNNKPQPSHTLTIGSEPSDLDPKIFWVQMLAKDTDAVWDRFVLVVNNRKTKERFDVWYDRNKTNTAWLAELPAAYVALSNRVNQTGFFDPEPATTNLWCTPDEPGQYIHHTAKYQMRSERTSGGHGHQTCYDDKGNIILKGVSAGTADFSSPRWHTFMPHIREDVDPFVRALQLDGNPCKRTFDSLTHALIYDGENLIKYRECRPAVPNDKPMLNPGEVP